MASLTTFLKKKFFCGLPDCPASVCPRFSQTSACVDNRPRLQLGCSSTDVVSINLLDVITTGILSSAVGQLTSLSLFSMQNCSLDALPASFSNLSGLQSLLLQQNRLRSLPFSLARFPQLNQVYLTDNPQLSGTIGSLATLTSLHTLQISGTQLSGQLALPLGVTNWCAVVASLCKPHRFCAATSPGRKSTAGCRRVRAIAFSACPMTIAKAPESSRAAWRQRC